MRFREIRPEGYFSRCVALIVCIGPKPRTIGLGNFDIIRSKSVMSDKIVECLIRISLNLKSGQP